MLSKKSYKFYLNKVVSTDEVAVLGKFACQLHLDIREMVENEK